MKKIISVMLCLLFVIQSAPVFCLAAGDSVPFEVEAESAVLMEAETGRVLYSKAQDKMLPPASVTKVMTLLLVMEAIDSGRIKLTDKVPVSEYAASMGGSQVFLEAGEEISAEDLLKSVVIASANDGAVAFAETIGQSEESFVKMMNDKAAALSMKNTNFENATGLDDDTKEHLTSAYDIALMSRELITAHPKILEYSSIWMDTIRGGEFGLTNTNRLIRFYKGATGLKTGSTSKAGFCISATAERDGMSLIAVIMGSETRDKRNESAKKLLDYGFANYGTFKTKASDGKTVKVIKGKAEKIKTVVEPVTVLLKKDMIDKIEIKEKYNEKITAPVKSKEKVGEVLYTVGDEEVARADILAAESVDALSYLDILLRLFRAAILA